MIAVDSSVAIASISTWHHLHMLANTIAGGGARIVAHAAIETYSALTRMPGEHRAAPADVRAALEDAFPDPPLTLTGLQVAELLRTFVAAGISGGACYDGLIAATALAADATLISADRRASRIYEIIGVDVTWL